MKINYFAKFFGLVSGCNEKLGWSCELLDYYLNIWDSLK